MAFDPDKYLAEKEAPAAGGFDPDAYLAARESGAPAPAASGGGQGILSKVGGFAKGVAKDYALPVLETIGEGINRVSVYPIAAGLSAAQDVAESDLDLPTWRQVPEGLRAFGKGAAGQFGRSAEGKPTYKDVLKRAGVSDQAQGEKRFVDQFVDPETGRRGFKSEFPSSAWSRLEPAPPEAATSSPADDLAFASELATPLPGLGQAGAALKAAKPVLKMAGEGLEMGAKAADIATGTKVASKSLGAAKTVAKGTAAAFKGAKEGLKSTFKAEQADDFAESVKTAMANGIDPKLLPEAVEFGPSSIVTRTARVQAEGIAGQPILEKFHEGLDQVRGAVRADIERLGMGAPLSRPEAGAVLREGFNQGVDRAFDAVKTSHRQIIEAAPGLRLSQKAIGDLAPKLQELETWAKAKAETGLTTTAQEQGRQILRAVQKLRSKGDSYAGAYEALNEIGDTAFKKTKPGADIAPDVARFRKLYGEISDAMISTVDDAFGAGQGQALREANKAMHKIYGDKSLLGKIADSDLADENLFQSIIEQGDTKRIAALKEYLEPEQLAALKGAFLDGLIKADSEGKFPFRSLHNALRQKNSVASVLFEPGELDNLQSLVKLGDKFGSAVMSTSGTGASNAIRESVREIANSAADQSIAQGVKQRARAIGFNVDDLPGKAAAKRPGPGPIMGFGPGGRFSSLPDFNPRARAARAFSTYQEDDEE